MVGINYGGEQKDKCKNAAKYPPLSSAILHKFEGKTCCVLVVSLCVAWFDLLALYVVFAIRIADCLDFAVPKVPALDA